MHLKMKDKRCLGKKCNCAKRVTMKKIPPQYFFLTDGYAEENFLINHNTIISILYNRCFLMDRNLVNMSVVTGRYDKLLHNNRCNNPLQEHSAQLIAMTYHP